MSATGCAVCGSPYFPPTGALCHDCDEVTESFTPLMRKRVEAMTSEQANEFLRKRKTQLAERAAKRKATLAPAHDTTEVS